MTKVLITGGSGLVGRKLTERLLKLNYEVIHLSRTKKEGPVKTYQWDYKKNYMEREAFHEVDHIIHLAGATVSKKWTEAYKKEILQSRVKTTELLFESAQKAADLKSFISASAVGYYGLRTSSEIMKESVFPADDFFGEVCAAWEKSVSRFSEINIPTSILRISVVLSAEGGALEKLLPPAKLGLSAAVGSGKQWMPWIHIDDLVEMFVFALENPDKPGIFNAAADEHVNNKEFTAQLAAALGKPYFLPNVPAFGLQMMLGEMAQIILEGSRVDNSKIKTAGFQFRFNKLQDALQDLV
ncbi:MAG: TIGR01777 family oxidoreductase [Flavobacteriales bacterium]|nr:TIGR01777 family oxidoreductase [Flavobacteriales bacterium]